MMLCLKAAIDGLKAQGLPVDDNLLEHLSPLGWVQINLTSRLCLGARIGVWKGGYQKVCVWVIS